jgi:hypothetical protein
LVCNGNFNKFQVGEQVPNHFTNEEWMALFTCPGSRQILQSIRHFKMKRSLKLKNLIEKRASLRSKQRYHEEEIKKRQEEEHIVYGLGHNSIFLRFYRPKMEAFENARVIWNFHEWGQPLVIDLVTLYLMK